MYMYMYMYLYVMCTLRSFRYYTSCLLEKELSGYLEIITTNQD